MEMRPILVHFANEGRIRGETHATVFEQVPRGLPVRHVDVARILIKDRLGGLKSADHSDLVMGHQIRELPTVALFHMGKLIAQTSEPIDRTHFPTWLKQALEKIGK